MSNDTSDDDIDDIGDIDESTDSDQPHTRRRRKRRKLNVIESDDSEDDSIGEAETTDYASSRSRGLSRWNRGLGYLADSPEARPKTKRRIHIPKVPSYPRDTFSTQPSQCSSSPYRIGHFYWQKPEKPDVVDVPKTVHSSPSGAGSPSSEEKGNHLLAKERDTLVTPSSIYNSKKHKVDSILQDIPVSHGSANDPSPQQTSLPEAEENLAQAYDDVLADLPSDAFSSPIGSDEEATRGLILSPPQHTSTLSQSAQCQRFAAPIANLRQTTLFGREVSENSSQSQVTRKHNWPLANREEPPTHHMLDQDALKTWIYPTNLGTIREYQFSIVARGLFHNMLVALPTGLGKTFIAATIMLNWFRWTLDAQLVFVAPTKPLVSQQVNACFEVAGIPRSATTMLTGGTAPGIRAEEWRSKRVFFMTPQTIINDLKSGICDPKRIVLLVVDEAHRATGGYAYVEVVKFLSRFNSSFRVLALTATPGSSIESVQEVIDGLQISRIEIRTEDSIDIRQYVHSRKVETVLFEYSEEMVMIMGLFSQALQPVLDKLNGMNAYWMKDPISLTPYGCNQARIKWMGSDAGRNANFGLKGMVNTIFSLLASLAHGVELLKYHGIGPFFHKVQGFRQGEDGKGGKYRQQILESKSFQTMMSRVQTWINNPAFVGHPKLDYVQNIVMGHFVDAGEGRGVSDPSCTRIMVFAHFRDSAEEITSVLKRHEPMIRPRVFVGQTSSKGSEGMDQKTQLDVIKQFQSGIYNTLVATSIGEEGLDIGEVDLIICYDASASPIRMLQRMGRTGRKRAGNIIVTLMKGKEEDNFSKAKDSYEKMQKEIAAGSRFTYHDEQSRRIVPKDVQPIVNKTIVEIPLENTQAELPEPKKRARPPKRPPKKFHMPDGVHTGFVKASRINNDEATDEDNQQTDSRAQKPKILPEPIPSLDDVLLTPAEQLELERTYLDVRGDTPQIVDVPRLDAFPNLQRSFRRTKYVGHGQATKRVVGMLKSIHNASSISADHYEKHLSMPDREAGNVQAEKRSAFFRRLSNTSGLEAREKLPRGEPAEALSRTNGTIDKVSFFGSPIETDHDDSLDNVTEDDLIDSSAPLPSNLIKPQCQSSTAFHGTKLDSDDDFPEFSTLIQKSDPTAEVTRTTSSNKNIGRPSQWKGKKKRLLIEDDDSDDC